jgi:predicted ATPase/class 3 adenylate cyclase
MGGLPSGTVTFLFTDIEGSTAHWDRDRRSMATALRRHDALLAETIESHAGAVFKTVGDAFCAVFDRAPDAVAAAADAQRRLGVEAPVRVRMAIHSGSAEERDADYFGPPVNRVARLLSLAHGGQVLLSRASAELVRGEHPQGTRLQDLGSHRLKDLDEPEHVFQLVVEGLRADFPPLRSVGTRPTNLTPQATPLVGRERERHDVCGLLRRADVRLLTLSGPGGTGKTRLALEAAAELLEEFEDGAFVVLLAAVEDPDLVLPTIAQTLGLRERGSEPLDALLRAHLAERSLLLVVDNFEQVADAAPAVSELLVQAPSVKVLVTSRFSLRVSAEREYPVPPLALPDPGRLPDLLALSQYDAVKLFIERAQAVVPGFELTSENGPAVAEICVRLDGLPLAIELAAARTKVLPPEALLDRLQQRLTLLTGGARDLPERQQTLRGAIDWSHGLLDDGEQTLFRRLGIFAGGCTLGAAEEIAEADLDLLGSLVDKSLVQQREAAAAEPRFVQLETLREYALERLEASGEREDLARRHAEYFTTLAEVSEERMREGDEANQVKLLEAELENLRAALAWSHGSVELELRLASALFTFWTLRGYMTEGRRWLDDAIGRSGGAPAALRAKALAATGGMAYRQADYARSTEVWTEALELFRELDDATGTARMIGELGNVAVAEGELERALELYDECARVLRESGDRLRLANVIGNMGAVANIQQDYERGRRLCEEALQLERELGSTEGTALTLHNIARIDLATGRPEEARRGFRESIEGATEIGYRELIAYCLEGLGELAAAAGDPRGAARLVGASEGLFDELGVPMQDNEGESYARTVEALGAALGEEEFARLRLEGRELGPAEAVELALGQPNRAATSA